MVPTGVASAPSVFAETSKVPFYVAGALLVCWAVALSTLGARRSGGFPGSARAARLAMLGSAVLVAATMTSAVLTGSGPEGHAASAGGPAPATAKLAVKAGGALAYDTTRLTLRAGSAAIEFANPSAVPHNVTIAQGDRNLAATETITGGSSTLRVKLSPGTYVFFCSVDAHRQAGMEGSLTVR